MTDGSTPARAVDHIAIAVPDLEEGAALFERLLGSPPLWVREAPEQGVKVVMFQLGDVKVELLAGTGPDSVVTRFVEDRGAGLHHICYAVDDLVATMDRLAADGFELLGQGEDVGVEGRPVVFLHPRSTGGVLTEFIEGADDPQADRKSG